MIKLFTLDLIFGKPRISIGQNLFNILNVWFGGSNISNITFFTADKLAPFPRIHKKLYHRTIGDGSQREPERDNSCRHGIGGLCRYFLLKWRFCYWAILLRNIRLQNFTGKSWNTGNVLGSKNLFRKLMFSNLSPAFHNSARKDKIQYSAQDQSRLYTVQWTHRWF